MTVLAIYAEVIDHIKHKASEECVCKIEKRCCDRVKFDQEAVLIKDITQPEVWTENTENRIGHHHYNQVYDNDVKDNAPLLNHLKLDRILF